jgi:EAL domain-containing protein (putative c-di-GMP-specific phosphodiesterase class I)
LLDAVPELTVASEIAERMLRALREPIALQGRDFVVRASIGIIVAEPDWSDVNAVLRGADVAMYVAKNQGRGRYAIFQASMYEAVLERLALKADLRQALDNEEFFLEYQPTIDLATGRISGVEALVRWRHPRRGTIAPAAFISLAEETGAIIPLGQWVLRQACRQIRAWQRQYPDDPPLTVSVNLSARQLQEDDLVADVEAALRETGLTPSTLMLEITESVLVQNPDTTSRRLQQLKALGVRLAIDDFGTGYSSLGYLQRFPVDVLKIDKSFVDDVGPDSPRAALVETIVQMGRTLQLQTVAEGIEEDHQRRTLHDLGCQLGQGFYFSQPLDQRGIEALLAEAGSRAA